VPTLHTVNKSSFERNALKSCVNHLSPSDAILMFEDAVVGARKGSIAEELVQDALKTCAVYALGPDLAARGLAAADVVAGVRVIDYGGFVDLAVEYQRTHAWL
jgi:tRNA 2-thiouridine synthesizing protein B